MEESHSPSPCTCGWESPECPVCLQPYDSESTIPRVLACGHTACEGCLASLPQKFPLAVRCPACTQLVKFPSPLGPTSLPKNIDLLRLAAPTPTTTTKGEPHPPPYAPPPRLWSEEFYATWRKWVLEDDAVSTVDGQQVVAGGKVGVFKVGQVGLEVEGSVFSTKVSYFAGVLNALSGMSEGLREELAFVLGIGSLRGRCNRIHGLWGDSRDGSLYLVSEDLESLPVFEGGLRGDDGLASFVAMGMEMCEALMGLHLEGVGTGCLGPSCFKLDWLGRVSLSLSEALAMGRGVREDVMAAGLVSGMVGAKELAELVGGFLRKEVFLSPELSYEVFKQEGLVPNAGFECGGSPVSDVWSVGCVLIRLLLGKKFTEEVTAYVDALVLAADENNGEDFQGLYVGFVQKVSSLLSAELGEELLSLQNVLCSCLDFHPNRRPLLTHIWKCIRELIFKCQCETLRLLGHFNEETEGRCLVLGELCQSHNKRSETCKENTLQDLEKINAGEDSYEDEDVIVDKDFIKGLLEGKLKSKDMPGHLDCVTGLAIGGGFLFSISYDKLVHVWSLQDFSHVHAFKGHEHKIMAVIYVDEEEPLCVTGDGGGGIFLWSTRLPLRDEPIKHWYEKKDWRYSGIHSLIAAGNGYLYTGSGDRSIKVWSLQDGTLRCSMNGHRSVVSSLAVCNGILYSGSWDGTIRLWSLTDHSLLTVLGEDVPGTVTSVLSIKANRNLLVAAHESGHIKLWKNDMLETSIKSHVGSTFAVEMDENLLFSGGWDKIINVQEISGDELQIQVRPIGSITGTSVITAMLCWQGKLFVGYGDRKLKVYYNGK